MNTHEHIDVALVYDFDGTLSPGNMQEYGFVQAIGKDPAAFWQRTHELSTLNNASQILCYMYLMLQEAHANHIALRRDTFARFGSHVPLFNGLDSWFARINAYGQSIGLNIKHYINSSGLKEMIEGTSIATHFEDIYACSFLYNDEGIAYWPAVAVDFTTKTQFLFRINKGIDTISDNSRINQYIPLNDRPLPFERMIYFGDGETDIPCMKMVKENGGHSMAVYSTPNKKATAMQLIRDQRVNFACLADYSEASEIHTTVQRILNKIRADYDFQQLLEHHKSAAALLP